MLMTKAKFEKSCEQPSLPGREHALHEGRGLNLGTSYFFRQTRERMASRRLRKPVFDVQMDG